MLGPDEGSYVGQAAYIQEHRLKAYRALAAGYIESPEAKTVPGPLRWLYLTILALTRPGWVQNVSWVILGPLAVWALGVPWTAGLWVAASPLAWMLGRRLLQDVPIAALTLVCIGCALHGSWLGLALGTFALLSCKEAAVFVLPALLLAWPGGWPALIGACFMWLAALFGIFGKQTVPLFKAARSGHNTEYGLKNQKGAPHRLLVDLFLLSPVAVIAAIWVHTPIIIALTAALLAAHALAPVRNIRLVLVADLIIRCTLIPIWMLPAAIAYDVYVAWRTRIIYDPVTKALTETLT